MAVSKRTRFEVLRRDNFTCRYCRSTEGELTIDHVLPVALGGTDDPDNLVAACRDCNAGKGSSGPDEGTVADVAEDAIRWADAVKRAAQEVAAERAAETEILAPFHEQFHHWLPLGWEEIVRGWLKSGLTFDEAVDCMDVALSKEFLSSRGLFPYACGIAKNKIRDLHERARQIVAENSIGGDR